MKTNISVKLIVMFFIVLTFVFGGCKEAIDQIADAIADSSIIADTSADLSSSEKVATDDSMNLISSIAQDIVPKAATYTATQTSETMTVGGREVQAKVKKISTGTGPTKLEVEFPASEDISGTVELEVNTDGTWSMSSKDETPLSFTTEDETGKTGQSKIKYENAKMDEKGEIQEGTVKVDDKKLETALMKAMNKLNKVSAMMYDEVLDPDTTGFMKAATSSKTTTFEVLDKDNKPLTGISKEVIEDSDDPNYETITDARYVEILNKIGGISGSEGRKFKGTTVMKTIVAKDTFTTKDGEAIEFEMDVEQSSELEITYDADGMIAAKKVSWKIKINTLEVTVDKETIVFSNVVLTTIDDDVTDGVDSGKSRWAGTIMVGDYTMPLEKMPFRLMTKMFSNAMPPKPWVILEPMKPTWDSIDPDMQDAILKMMTLKDEINTDVIAMVDTLTTGASHTFTNFGSALITIDDEESPGVKKITLGFHTDENSPENDRYVDIITFDDGRYTLSGMLEATGFGTRKYLLVTGDILTSAEHVVVGSDGIYSDGILTVFDLPLEGENPDYTRIPVTDIPTSATNTESAWDSIDSDMQDAILKMMTLKDEINTEIIARVDQLTTGGSHTFTNFGLASITIDDAQSPGVKEIELGFNIDLENQENMRYVDIITFNDGHYTLSGMLDATGSGTRKYLLVTSDIITSVEHVVVGTDGSYSDGALLVFDLPVDVENLDYTRIPVTDIPTSATNTESAWDSIDSDMQDAILKMMTLKDEINTEIIAKVDQLASEGEHTFTNFGLASITIGNAQSPGVKEIRLDFNIDLENPENMRYVDIITLNDGSYNLSGVLETTGSGTKEYLLVIGDRFTSSMEPVVVVGSDGSYSDGALLVLDLPVDVEKPDYTRIPVTDIPATATN